MRVRIFTTKDYTLLEKAKVRGFHTSDLAKETIRGNEYGRPAATQLSDWSIVLTCITFNSVIGYVLHWISQ